MAFSQWYYTFIFMYYNMDVSMLMVYTHMADAKGAVYK